MRLFARVLVVGLAVAAAVLAATRVLTPIFRSRPEGVMRPLGKAMRWLNRLYLGMSERLPIAPPPLVYHTGRTSGREYATPLCVSSTPSGFIVPAAFGTQADWFRNLTANPSARVRYEGVTYLVQAEAIDADEALRLAGGRPGCPCWHELDIRDFMLLRPAA